MILDVSINRPLERSLLFSPFPFYLLDFHTWVASLWMSFAWASMVNPFLFFSLKKFGLFGEIGLLGGFLTRTTPHQNHAQGVVAFRGGRAGVL